ncbi:MAG: hypothetical protein FLDDKLPJ_01091 [Phycisphaerae bacterium]|nr:hypothetical protein [Phycisphaerae bacterium]
MIAWIIGLAFSASSEKPSWLLVPLTVIYAVFTLWMAAAAFQNAVAARRSAEAMEASVEEQRQSRWAAYAATLTFPEGLTFRPNADGAVTFSLGNPYRQPMLGLWIRIWDMEPQGAGPGSIKYSTMRESVPKDVEASDASVTVQVKPTTQPEAERVRVGDLALKRYKEVFSGEVPKSTLCVITYRHRAQLGDVILVYDFKPAST